MSDKTTLDVLREARELLSDPKRWTKGAMARFGNNHEASFADDRAQRFCALGALNRVGEEIAPIRSAVEVLSGEADGLVRFNDRSTTTHADLLLVFDRAIAIAEARS